MDLSAKKMAFIEEYIHLKNEQLIDKLSSLLKKEKNKQYRKRRSLADFMGIMNEAEGNEFKKDIEEGCEKIDN
jgi:hypothetical protein